MKKVTLMLSVVCALLLCSFAPDWLLLENGPGRFKVQFPRAPEESEQDLDTEIGKVKMKMFLYEPGKYKDDNVTYGLLYCDYPDTLVNSDFKDEILETFFKGGIEGAAKNMNGTIVSVKKTTFKGYPGRLAKIKVVEGQAYVSMQMYLVKNRSYFLEVVYEKAKDNNPSIQKFFNSFQLVGQ